MRWRRGRQTAEIDDRRGSSGPAIAGGGIGLGVVAAIGYLLFGINPATTLHAGQFGSAVNTSSSSDKQKNDEAKQFVNVIGTNINDVWNDLVIDYEAPKIVLYTGHTQTNGCGEGSTAVGPFYCPADRTVYLDLSFWDTLKQDLGGGGDFANAYVVAHEIGHHIQTFTGASKLVNEKQRSANTRGEANKWSVALELQADCYAGVWAARAADVSNNEVSLESGDIEKGLKTASAIGDDTLSHGTSTTEQFTHGSSSQRVQWLKIGFESKDPSKCQTFSKLEAGNSLHDQDWKTM